MVGPLAPTLLLRFPVCTHLPFARAMQRLLLQQGRRQHSKQHLQRPVCSKPNGVERLSLFGGCHELGVGPCSSKRIKQGGHAAHCSGSGDSRKKCLKPLALESVAEPPAHMRSQKQPQSASRKDPWESPSSSLALGLRVAARSLWASDSGAAPPPSLLKPPPDQHAAL